MLDRRLHAFRPDLADLALNGQVDADRFAHLAARGRRALAAGETDDAEALFVEALGLWRGSALGDLSYEEFAQGEAARLEELRLVALEELADARLASGVHAELVPELERLVAEHPFRKVVDSDLSELETQLTLAMKWNTPLGVIGLGLTENVFNMDNTPDIGLHFSWGLLVRRKDGAGD